VEDLARDRESFTRAVKNPMFYEEQASFDEDGALLKNMH
jgi:hypothetical protein